MVSGRFPSRDGRFGAARQGGVKGVWSGSAVTVYCGLAVPGSGGVAVLVNEAAEDIIAPDACELRDAGRW